MLLVLGISTFKRHDRSCGLHKSSPVSVVAHAPMNPRTSSEVSDDFFMDSLIELELGNARGAAFPTVPQQRHARAKTVSQYPIGAPDALGSAQ
jgi:hypothetical protein